MRISRSPKLYQQRKLPMDRETLQRTGPRFAPELSRVHKLPIEPPYPSPDAIRELSSTQPDAGGTVVITDV